MVARRIGTHKPAGEGKSRRPKAPQSQYRMLIDKRTEEIMRDKETAEAVMSLNGLQKRHGVWSDVRQGGDASAMQIGALNQDARAPLLSE